jgi:hypothetical protein
MEKIKPEFRIRNEPDSRSVTTKVELSLGVAMRWLAEEKHIPLGTSGREMSLATVQLPIETTVMDGSALVTYNSPFSQSAAIKEAVFGLVCVPKSVLTGTDITRVCPMANVPKMNSRNNAFIRIVKALLQAYYYLYPTKIIAKCQVALLITKKALKNMEFMRLG